MKLSDYFTLQGIASGFFMFFFIIYVGKFGLNNLIFESTSVWGIMFNIGIWYVLLSYCIDKFFSSAEKKHKQKLKGKAK